MFSKFRTKRCSGFTLTEVAIVLGIFGVITAAIWQTASSARESQKENEAINELQTVAQNILTLMQGRNFDNVANATGCTAVSSTYVKTITSAMIAAQTIPSSYKNHGSSCLADNPWSPTWFYVYAMSPKTFRVSFYNVTYGGCLALLAAATSCQAGQSGCPFDVVTASGGTLFPTTPATDWSVMTATKESDLCTANTTGANSVEFDYYL